MADPNESNEPSGDSTRQPEGAPAFRIGNVLKVVMPFVLLGVGGFVFFGYFDGTKWLADLITPPLVPATGQVMYHGKPLEGAQITARHSSGKLTESLGWTDAEGRFTLRTDINGYVDGAFAGEHRVTVEAVEVQDAPVAPPLTTPAKYASIETTPMRITVSRDAAKNEYLFTLEGEPPERPNRNPGVGGNQQAPGEGVDLEAIVGQVFADYDKDHDQRLTGDEMQAVEGDRAERIRQADANEDGVVDRDELLQAFEAAQNE